MSFFVHASRLAWDIVQAKLPVLRREIEGILNNA